MRRALFVADHGLYLLSVNAGDSPHEGRLCDCVLECVGECDCESGSAKRIFACVVAASPLPHVNRRRRGSQAVEWERVPSQLGGATPPLSSLIMAHQKKKKKSGSVVFVCALTTTYCMGTQAYRRRAINHGGPCGGGEGEETFRAWKRRREWRQSGRHNAAVLLSSQNYRPMSQLLLGGQTHMIE